jgi:hypothetical protein
MMVGLWAERMAVSTTDFGADNWTSSARNENSTRLFVSHVTGRRGRLFVDLCHHQQCATAISQTLEVHMNGDALTRDMKVPPKESVQHLRKIEKQTNHQRAAITTITVNKTEISK